MAFLKQKTDRKEAISTVASTPKNKKIEGTEEEIFDISPIFSNDNLTLLMGIDPTIVRSLDISVLADIGVGLQFLSPQHTNSCTVQMTEVDTNEAVAVIESQIGQQHIIGLGLPISSSSYQRVEESSDWPTVSLDVLCQTDTISQKSTAFTMKNLSTKTSKEVETSDRDASSDSVHCQAVGLE